MILVPSLIIILLIMFLNTFLRGKYLRNFHFLPTLLTILWMVVFSKMAYHHSSFWKERILFYFGGVSLSIFALYQFRKQMNYEYLMREQEYEYSQLIKEYESVQFQEKIIENDISSLENKINTTSTIHKTTLSMSSTLDFQETLKAFAKGLSDLPGFEKLEIILSYSEEDEPEDTLKAFHLNQEIKDLESYPLKSDEEVLFNRAQEEKNTTHVEDPEAYGLHPSAFDISHENPAFIVPLYFQQDYSGVLVYFSHGEICPSHLEILSLHFSMELQKSALYEKIKRLSTIDNLTGTYLKRHFLPLLEEEIALRKQQKENLALLMIDIDHFKHINDRYGHLTGDRVLKKVSKAILSSCREGDLVARYGGDEFFLILPKITPGAAKEVAGRIQNSVNDITFTYTNDKEFRITLSVGIAFLDDTIKNKEQLIDAADKMLYEAKNEGRNLIKLSHFKPLPKVE